MTPQKKETGARQWVMGMIVFFKCIVYCSVNSCGELLNSGLLPKDETQ
jgi:hypothetical protein